jgi:5-oxoprolinase (ATP-hydrolysing)
MSSWQFWINRGGTFTDIVARHPTASLTLLKRSGTISGCRHRRIKSALGILFVHPSR